MTKLCIIGAGSTVFTKKIITDLLLIDKFHDMEFALMDVDKQRLKQTHEILLLIGKRLNLSLNITLHTDRREALKKSHFVQTTFQIGGYKPSTLIDFNIPKKYGLEQTIGDTIGIGGIMRGLRTIPVLNSIAQDMMEICPNAILLQYVNPMCINMLALYKKYPQIKAIGLCHSVQSTAKMIADDLGESIENLDYECVGINHLSFFTRLEKKLSNGLKKNLYPELKTFGQKILDDEILSTRSKNKSSYSNKILHEKVRYEVLKRFGFFVTESSEHFAEYVPWFIKKNDKKLIEKYKIPINEYIDRCEINTKLWENFGDSKNLIKSTELKKSEEYASEIINALVNNKKLVINGNVYNNKLIDNLPQDCVVEVPCIIDATGIKPKKIGKIPLNLSALMQTNINVQLLTAEAALTNKKELIYQAALLDPHTAAVLSIDEIYSLVDELLEAHRDFLPKYK